MQKVAILSHATHRDAVVEYLHDAGVLHITDEHEEKVIIDHTEMEFKEAEIQFAIDTLKESATPQTLKALDKKATIEEITSTALHADVRGIVDMLHTLEEEDTAAERTISEQVALQNQLKPWINLPYDLDQVSISGSTERVLGTVPIAQSSQLTQSLNREGIRLDMEDMGSENGLHHYCALVYRDDRERFEEIATNHGWSTVTLPVLPGLPSIIYQESVVQMQKASATREKNAQKRVELSAELPNLVHTQHFVQWLTEKRFAREAMLLTDQTITLFGCLPAKQLQRIEQELQNISPATTVLKIKPNKGEEAPVAIKNPLLITPFESVTTLYGLPLSNEMDPTVSLSPFFILYFALCLTDAGYGLVIALMFGIYLWRSKQSIEQAKLWWLIFFGGIMTFLVGIPFGGWFGLSPAQVPAALTYTTTDGQLFFLVQVWNLTHQSGIGFLQNLSLILGLTHLFFGMFLAGWHKWVHGNKVQALWEDFSAHFLLGSVLFLAFAPADLNQIATYLFYVCLVLFIWGKGYGTPWYIRPILGLLGAVNFAIGLLSNSLSFLRILALGLVTGAIAAAVNQVAIEMGKLLPIFLAIPLMVLICIGGHLVSIALNTLGSFIHSGRLQFIEFFSQFFEGGGKGYSPFRRS